MKTLTWIVAFLAIAAPISAQRAADDLAGRLRQVLPAAVADRVITTVSDARSSGLPARALEHRALMLAAKGIEARSIAQSIAEHSRAMGEARAALARGRNARPADAEIAAGAEVLRKGVDGAQVSELARKAPAGRSLAVPLFVLGSLVDRGLPSDAALARVVEGMNARATDAELSRLPEQAVAAGDRGEAARARAGGGGAKTTPPGAAARGAGVGTARGRPANVPPAAGGRGRPAGRGKP